MIPPTTDTGPTRTPTVRGLLAVALATTAIPVVAVEHLLAVATVAAVVVASALLGHVVLPAVVSALADGRCSFDVPGPLRFVLVVED
jgi:hypothetical protein